MVGIVSPKIHVEVLTPSMMLFGNEGFGRYLGLDGVLRVELSCGISALMRADPSALSAM